MRRSAASQAGRADPSASPIGASTPAALYTAVRLDMPRSLHLPVAGDGTAFLEGRAGMIHAVGSPGGTLVEPISTGSKLSLMKRFTNVMLCTNANDHFA